MTKTEINDIYIYKECRECGEQSAREWGGRTPGEILRN